MYFYISKHLNVSLFFRYLYKKHFLYIYTLWYWYFFLSKVLLPPDHDTAHVKQGNNLLLWTTSLESTFEYTESFK